MRRKIIFYLVISLFLLSLADFGLAKCATDNDCQRVADEAKRTIKCIDGECVRTLEITYPKIGGEELTTEKIVKEGLPAYVKYIFTLATGVIGLVIFGVLIYNGFLYLTSAGRPEQMTEARKGILAGFLGGIILLSAVLIFNTINPQLKIIKLEKISPLESVVIPGVYICNYKVGGQQVKIDNAITTIGEIGPILETYIDSKNTKTIEERNEAAKKLNAIMNINNQNELICQKLNASTNLQSPITKNETIFIVPFISNPEGKRLIEYKHGIILHEKENFRGRVDYFPKLGPGEGGSETIYRQIDNYSAKDLKFTARSVTIFRKPDTELTGDGVVLYENFQYNKVESGIEKKFPPDKGEIGEYKDLGELNDNARSISFSPEKYYLAILCSEKNFEGKCIVFSKEYPNLSDFLPTASGVCGFFSFFGIVKDCKPALKSMIVIKGTPL